MMFICKYNRGWNFLCDVYMQVQEDGKEDMDRNLLCILTRRRLTTTNTSSGKLKKYDQAQQLQVHQLPTLCLEPF